MPDLATVTVAPETEAAAALPVAAAPRRAFGLKDLFTTWNLLGGVLSLIAVIEGDIRWASYWLLIGYIGDVFDGMVARATKGSNRFGAEFDNIVDHLTQCIAPAVIVYVGFKGLGKPVAIGLASALVITGSIRHARSAVKRSEFSLCWAGGLPRTVSMLIAVSYLNSTLYSAALGGLWAGVALILFLAVMNVVPLPFLSHHGRNLQNYVRALIGGFFGTTAIAALVPALRPFTFDVVFFWMVGYMATSWIPMRPAERQEFFRVTRQWLRDIAAER
ncbi:MAG TPA: CDP-alcohol phosphatidyltransferase family protein [Polyangia bacterium]|jgi:CDP-diacylglycerol--serine O-phosphatidyltransferase